MANVYNSQLDAYSLYHKTQESTGPDIGPGLPALGHALAGSTGTAIANLAIYPLDLVITRLQVQRSLRKSFSVPDEGEYKGVIDAFEQIYNNEGGLKAFYTGVVQDTGKSVADSFLFFLFYNYFRTNRLQKHGNKATVLPVLEELAVGAIAGACSKAFTAPISNIVTRKQTASMMAARSLSPSSSVPTVTNIAKTIHAEKGIQGFWSGYSASLVLTLNPSVTFFLYETFKRALLSREERDDPGAKITFLMAAFSKAIASSITYPFSLAKTRAQASSKTPVDPASAEKVKDDFEHIHNEDEAKKAGREAKKFAKRSTVFNTIVEIYRTEGAAGLYEGIWGEILKGFFSNGITMLVKESVHKLIIQAYYLILKALNKYPSPSELANQAGTAIQDVGERAGEMVQEGYKNVSRRVGEAVENGKEAIGVGTERVGAVGSQTTKMVNDLGAKEAGHLLGNAQEQLGGNIEQVGQGIKPARPRQEIIDDS